MILMSSAEVAAIIDEVVHVTRTDDIHVYMQMSKARLRKIRNRSFPITNRELRLIHRGCREAVRRSLNPFNPPVLGAEVQWVDYCRSARAYLNQLISQMYLIRTPKEGRIYDGDEFLDAG